MARKITIEEKTISVRVDKERLATLSDLIQEVSGYPAPKIKRLLDQLMDNEIQHLSKMRKRKGA